MPPYNTTGKRAHNQPRKPTTVVVEILECNWCKAAGARKCTACDKPTCYRCLVRIEAGRCYHITYRPAQSTGWGTECPNPMCDADCNVCYGKGMLW